MNIDLCSDYARIKTNIVEGTVGYLGFNQSVKHLIVGVSGGIDSALTCALAMEVCKLTETKLIGLTMPIETNKSDEMRRAELVGKAFCYNWSSTLEPLDVLNAYRRTRTFANLHTEDSMSHEQKVRLGNLKARIRMIFLYDLAKQHNGMVLGTDNLSEFMLGHWTLHGDVGDYGMLQYLWKSEVYGLATHIMSNYNDGYARAYALERCIGAIPTAGLGVTDSDFDELGEDSYEKIDDILISFLKGQEDLKEHATIERHLKTNYKRLNPFNLTRENILQKCVWEGKK